MKQKISYLLNFENPYICIRNSTNFQTSKYFTRFVKNKKSGQIFIKRVLKFSIVMVHVKYHMTALLFLYLKSASWEAILVAGRPRSIIFRSLLHNFHLKWALITRDIHKVLPMVFITPIYSKSVFYVSIDQNLVGSPTLDIEHSASWD